MRSDRKMDELFKFHLNKNLPLSYNKKKERDIKKNETPKIFPQIVPDIFNISAFNTKFRETKFFKKIQKNFFYRKLHKNSYKFFKKK